MQLTSPAFMEGQPIPRKYSCDGADVSPLLRGARRRRHEELCAGLRRPGRTMGNWVHWVIYGLPATMRTCREGGDDRSAAERRETGLNDFRRVGYGGPCPPPGGPHRYFFRLYALDTELPLKPRRPSGTCCSRCRPHSGRNSADGNVRAGEVSGANASEPCPIRAHIEDRTLRMRNCLPHPPGAVALRGG